MAVFYNRVERPVPGNPQQKKWYAVLKMISQMSEKEVSMLISEETTLNPKEAEMALAQFYKVLIRALLDSKSVQLGDWGSFRVTCNSKAHDSKGDVNAHSIDKINIRFTPGKALLEALSHAMFEAAESIVTKQAASSGDGGGGSGGSGGGGIEE